MAIVKFNDRVRETSITTGTGDKLLAGAVSNFRAFGSVKADGDTFAVTQIMAPDFESLWVRYNSGANSLTPLFVFESSNGGDLVNWGAGTKDILEGLPAKLAQGQLALVSTFNFRVTPSTGVGVVNSAVTAATSIYCTPYHGNQRARYLGSYWTASAAVEDSLKLTDAQSGTTSTSSPNITGLADTSKIPLGYKISGTGIPANAVVGAIPGPTSVTIYVSGSPTNGTASATNTITFKAPANTGYDLYDDMTSTTLKLQAVVRAAIHTDPTYGSQDGVPTHPSIATLRHIAKFQTANTDGQIDYNVSGKYRYTIWNRYNRLYREHCESFSSNGTWWKSLCTTRVKSDVAGGSGSGGAGSSVGSDIASAGGPGAAGGRSIKVIYAATLGASEAITVGAATATSSFGSQHSASGGSNGSAGSGQTPGSPGSDGTGSSGDINLSGGGPAGGPGGGFGINAGGGTSAVASAQSGRGGWVIIDEIVEV